MNADSDNNGVGDFLYNDGAPDLTTNGGNVTITAADIAISGNNAFTSSQINTDGTTDGNVTINASNGRSISLASSPDAGTLGATDTELDQFINVGTMTFTTTGSGTI